ncbi:hypothetical protein [Bosea thiooxidans]
MPPATVKTRLHRARKLSAPGSRRRSVRC